MVSLPAYAGVSTLVTVAMVATLAAKHGQFYPLVVALSSSKAASLVLANFAIVVVIVLGQSIKSLFLGQLRDAEILNMQERLWATVMETLLSMTIFHDEFSYSLMVMLGVLLGIKIFHWLAADRVDHFARSLNQCTALEEQMLLLTRIYSLFIYAIHSYLDYTRLTALMLTLLVIDVCMAYDSGTKVIHQPPSTNILFTFEYIILTVLICATIIKFIMNTIDNATNGGWESKSLYILYLDFAVDVIQLGVYSVFFVSLMQNYGLPLHLIRVIYLVFRSFFRRLGQVLRYHKATRDMEVRFPIATPDQLENADVCIVCREPMEQARIMPCGHMMHSRCLLRWLERTQSCPICRRDFVDGPDEAPGPNGPPGAPFPNMPFPPHGPMGPPFGFHPHMFPLHPHPHQHPQAPEVPRPGPAAEHQPRPPVQPPAAPAGGAGGGSQPSTRPVTPSQPQGSAPSTPARESQPSTSSPPSLAGSPFPPNYPYPTDPNIPFPPFPLRYQLPFPRPEERLATGASVNQVLLEQVFLLNQQVAMLQEHVEVLNALVQDRPDLNADDGGDSTINDDRSSNPPPSSSSFSSQNSPDFATPPPKPTQFSFPLSNSSSSTPITQSGSTAPSLLPNSTSTEAASASAVASTPTLVRTSSASDTSSEPESDDIEEVRKRRMLRFSSPSQSQS